MGHIIDNVVLLATIALSFVAWLVAFVGACVFRRGLSGGAWWIIVYELLLIVIITLVCFTNTFAHYRMMILTFLAASIAMVTFQLDYALPNDKFSTVYRGGAGAYAAGYIILIIIQFLWVVIFGSEPESYFGRYAPSYYNNSVGVASAALPTSVPSATSNIQQQHNSSYEITSDKTILPSSAEPAATSNHTAGNDPTVTATQPNTVSVDMAPQPDSLDYREKVQALHGYQASPDDPNELSFVKGETLNIADRNGNWWQARKEDGTTGIIPSNYFAPPLS